MKILKKTFQSGGEKPDFLPAMRKPKLPISRFPFFMSVFPRRYLIPPSVNGLLFRLIYFVKNKDI